jgi:hypothetical protein
VVEAQQHPTPDELEDFDDLVNDDDEDELTDEPDPHGELPPDEGKA